MSLGTSYGRKWTYNSHDVTRIRWLGIIIDLFIIEECQTLTLDFNIVLFLLEFFRLSRLEIVRGIFLLLPLLLLLVLLGVPNLVDIQQFNSDNIALESTISIFRATNVDIRLKNVCGNVCVRAILFVYPKETHDKLTSIKQWRKRSLRKVWRKERLSLRSTRCLLKLHLESLLLLPQALASWSGKSRRGKQVWEHIREAERCHLAVATTGSCSELRQRL